LRRSVLHRWSERLAKRGIAVVQASTRRITLRLLRW
jgi:hypothetical protein